jgi:hypothetical protein
MFSFLLFSCLHFSSHHSHPVPPSSFLSFRLHLRFSFSLLFFSILIRILHSPILSTLTCTIVRPGLTSWEPEGEGQIRYLPRT